MKRNRENSANDEPEPRLNCPACKTSIKWSERFPFRPFCSKRCKDSDFIDWTNEENRIAGSYQYDDVFSEDPPS